MAIMFQGLDDLEKGLMKRADLDLVRDIVKKNGAKLQNSMVRKANFVKGFQTGTTKRSIELDIQDNGMTAKVAPGTEYSPYLEYGTRYMEAQPFVGPAFNEVKGQFKADMEQLIK